MFPGEKGASHPVSNVRIRKACLSRRGNQGSMSNDSSAMSDGSFYEFLVIFFLITSYSFPFLT
jgi:hypothetical protein